MDDQKQQLIDTLQSSTNILVTVSSNPSVDQLAACVALTIALNKLDKHATAVFSGEIPETIDFLKPEDTIEKNTDSLRDFIIALDKTKADKLRYKVEDKVVKIFITPYRTSITSDDLNFSQGDFNVDAVLALGVREQQQLDQAITAHGRILHDATVLGIHNQTGSELGSINWIDTNASSLSELAAMLLKQLDKKVMDEQIATALLTGIVASTDRFRNENTSAATMSVSADLMAAGANQQLVTSQLDHALELRDRPADDEHDQQTDQADKAKDKPESKDGTLEIDHETAKTDDDNDIAFDAEKFETHEHEPERTDGMPAEQTPPALQADVTPQPTEPANDGAGRRGVMTQAPQFTSPLTANSRKEDTSPYQPSPELDGEKNSEGLLSRTKLKPTETPDLSSLPSLEAPAQPTAPPSEPTFGDLPKLHPESSASPATLPSLGKVEAPTPPQPLPEPPTFGATPAASPFAPEPSAPVATPQQPESTPSLVPEIDIDAARDEVMRALSEQPDETLPPVAALNAQPMGGELHPSPHSAPPQPQHPAAASPAQPLTPAGPDLPPASHSPADQPMDMPLPPSTGLHMKPPQSQPPTDAPAGSAPPPVPPPMLPPTWPGPQ